MREDAAKIVKAIDTFQNKYEDSIAEYIKKWDEKIIELEKNVFIAMLIGKEGPNYHLSHLDTRYWYMIWKDTK